MLPSVVLNIQQIAFNCRNVATDISTMRLLADILWNNSEEQRAATLLLG
jgi:hypothetical protein